LVTAEIVCGQLPRVAARTSWSCGQLSNDYTAKQWVVLSCGVSTLTGSNWLGRTELAKRGELGKRQEFVWKPDS